MCWLKSETILLSLNLKTKWDVLYKKKWYRIVQDTDSFFKYMICKQICTCQGNDLFISEYPELWMVVKDFEFNILQDASCNTGTSLIHGTDLWLGQPWSKSKSLLGDARGNSVEYWTPRLCSTTCCLVCSFSGVSCYFSDSFNRWALFSVCIDRAESCLRLSAVIFRILQTYNVISALIKRLLVCVSWPKMGHHSLWGGLHCPG